MSKINRINCLPNYNHLIGLEYKRMMKEIESRIKIPKDLICECDYGRLHSDAVWREEDRHTDYLFLFLFLHKTPPPTEIYCLLVIIAK